MKKRFSLILALVLIVALLAGCGGANGYPAAGGMYNSKEDTMPSSAAAPGGYGGYYDESIYGEPVTPQSPELDMPADGQTASVLPPNVKLIYRAGIELESTGFDAAVAAVEKLAAECGGYFENSSIDNYGSYRYANYVIRVPAQNFERFCSTLSEMGKAGEVFQLNSISRSAEDVSERYYDIESRLATQQTKLERLQALLAQADIMEDIITIESAISETELAIEQLTGSLRHYDSLVGYSTIDLSLREVTRLSDVEEPPIGFGARLSAAFRAGGKRFVARWQDFLVALANGWIGWLIFIVIVVLAVIFICRAVRRGKARRAAGKGDRGVPPPPPAPQPQPQPKAPEAEEPKE